MRNWLALAFLFLAAPVFAQGQPVVIIDRATGAQVGVATETTLNTRLADATFTGRFPAAAVGADGESNATAVSRVGVRLFVFNSATWDRLLGDATNGMFVQVKASVLPTGAATEATLASLNGKVTAVNTGAVTIAAMPNEGQQTMANSISVAISSDQSAVPVSDGGGSLTVDGTVTANQGGSPWQVQSNSANIATQATLASILTALTSDPCKANVKTRVAFSIASATTTQLIAASASNKNYICDLDIVVSVADNVAMVEDDTAACASPTAGMAGGTTAASGWNFAANGGLVKGNGDATVYQTAATNRYTCFITSSAAQVSGSLSYVQVP